MLEVNYMPFWAMMEKRGKTREHLRQDLKLSPTVIAKLSVKKNQFVSLKTVVLLCDYLNCEIHDIVQLKPGQKGNYNYIYEKKGGKT